MKTKQNILFAILMACACVFTFASCDDDDPIPESVVSWKVSLPDDVLDPELLGMQVTFTNINTNAEYTGSMGTLTKADVPAAAPRVVLAEVDGAVSVTATVPEGLYRIAAEGKISYKVNKDMPETKASIRAYQDAVTISGMTMSMTAQECRFYTTSEGFVIAEIFYGGSSVGEDDWYQDDQYIRICNNSADTLYADGLAVMGSAFNTSMKNDYVPDIMDKSISVGFVYVIPGSGTEHAVAPGASVVVAITGIDHSAEVGNALDLSHADFEFYDENDIYPDTDGAEVPNMDTWWKSSRTVTGLHTNGLEAYFIGKMGVDKQTFIKDYKYKAKYYFVHPALPEPVEMGSECYFVPNSWVIDAVNLSTPDKFEWTVCSPLLDAGWTTCAAKFSDMNRFDKSVSRKVASVENGRQILMDTNNSTNDFEVTRPSLKK